MNKYNKTKKIILIMIVIILAISEMTALNNVPLVFVHAESDKAILMSGSFSEGKLYFIERKKESEKIPFVSLNKILKSIALFDSQATRFIILIIIGMIMPYIVVKHFVVYFNGSKYKGASFCY